MPATLVMICDAAFTRRMALLPKSATYKFPAASTETLDRGKKLRIYARQGVGHAWLLDPLRRRLEVLSLEVGAWTPLQTHEGGGRIRAEPFDAMELELDALWPVEAA